MDNGINFTQEQIDSVRKEITDADGNTDINSFMEKHLDDGQRQAVKNLLSDPERLRTIINSPLAKAFMERFRKEEKE